MTGGLDISYKRSPENSFMIIEGDPFDPGFEERMLRENEVRALLAFYSVEIDRRIQIWYAITGKRSLRDLVDQDGLSLENMELILRSMAAAWMTIRDYLISKEHLYMSVDTVYFEKEKDHYGAYLCYCPFDHPSTEEQLKSIMEYFVSVVDHSKEEITRLCYELYEAAAQNTGFDGLIALTEKYNNKYDNGLSDHVFIECFEGDNEEKEDEEPVFIEDYEEKKKFKLSLPKPHIFSDLVNRIKEWFGRMMRIFLPDKKRTVRELSPLDEDMLVFDPEISLHEPTVIMREDDREFIGKLIYEGTGDELDYLINKRIFRIGSRSDDNDANLNSPMVSRNHATITLENNEYCIEDMNSRNGTFVNGKLIDYKEKIVLNRMDRISFADVRYRIV